MSELDLARIAAAWVRIDELMHKAERRWPERKSRSGPRGFDGFGQGVDDVPFFLQNGVYLSLVETPAFGLVVFEDDGRRPRLIGEEGVLGIGVRGLPERPGLN